MYKFFNDIQLREDLAEKPKLYIYFSSNACGHCKITKPKVMEFAEANQELVYLIDSREAKELQEQLNIYSYPSMVLIENNKLIKGGVGAGQIEQMIKDGKSN